MRNVVFSTLVFRPCWFRYNYVVSNCWVQPVTVGSSAGYKLHELEQVESQWPIPRNAIAWETDMRNLPVNERGVFHLRDRYPDDTIIFIEYQCNEYLGFLASAKHLHT